MSQEAVLAAVEEAPSLLVAALAATAEFTVVVVVAAVGLLMRARQIMAVMAARAL